MAANGDGTIQARQFEPFEPTRRGGHHDQLATLFPTSSRGSKQQSEPAVVECTQAIEIDNRITGAIEMCHEPITKDRQGRQVDYAVEGQDPMVVDHIGSGS